MLQNDVLGELRRTEAITVRTNGRLYLGQTEGKKCEWTDNCSEDSRVAYSDLRRGHTVRTDGRIQCRQTDTCNKNGRKTYSKISRIVAVRTDGSHMGRTKAKLQ